MSTYTYSIQTDFPDHKVSSDRLTLEIHESAIVTALDGINTSGDVCDIVFKAALSTDDEIILDALVASHSGEPLPDIKEPRALDGKLYVSPDMWQIGTITNFTGAADDVTNGIVGTDLLAMESTQVEDKEKTFQFIEISYIAGGHIQYNGAVFGDHVSFRTVVPGTAGTSVGAGNGAYAKSPIGGGLSVFVPYPGGGWDLDLTEKENAHVSFTKVRPVPSPGNHGFFDWNEDTEAVTVNAQQKGTYHLIDGDVVINKFVTRIAIIGSDHFPLTVPAVRPVRLLPHWRHVVTLHNSTAKTLQLAAMLYRGKWNSV